MKETATTTNSRVPFLLFDTFAVIEFLEDTGKGRKVFSLMKEEPPSISVVSISELASWLRKKGLDSKKIILRLKDSLTVLPLSESAAELGGELHYEIKKNTPGWEMVDSIIYATALENGLKLVTGDKHFQNRPETIFL